MEFLSAYGLFLAKTVTITAALLVIIAALVSSAAKGKKEEKGSIKTVHLNKRIEKLSDDIRDVVEDEAARKLAHKQAKKQEKAQQKANRKLARGQQGGAPRKRVYVIDFHGDSKASQVASLRQVITGVLEVIRPGTDEVLLRLESPGGMVHSYGLAASQLARIRQRDIPLTVCVDKVAASGGYMMACLGSKIVAAPFAYIGSIGVVLQLPNFHRLLKDKNVDFEMITAGEYKRTLTVFGENTEKGREKMSREVQETHDLFKNFVKEARPGLDINEVATGETWFGTEAVEKGLTDEVKSSDECIVEACRDADVFAVSYEARKKPLEKLGLAVETALDNTFMKWLNRSPEDHMS